MSGHSKFANIKHKKEKNDAAKGKTFTMIGREIAMIRLTAGLKKRPGMLRMSITRQLHTKATGRAAQPLSWMP